MTPQQAVDAWNRDNEVGRVVRIRTDYGEHFLAVTKTHAFIDIWELSLYHKSPMILIDAGDLKGPCSLSKIEPYDGVGDIHDAPRAGGGILCQVCNKPLRDHPADLEHLAKGGIPFLTKLCDGRIVKL